MEHRGFQLALGRRWIVGSFGDAADLAAAIPEQVPEACDLAEIRLDLMAATGSGCQATDWRRLENIPLLFTARRPEEGGAGNLTAIQRQALLECAFDDAALIDIEVASIPDMPELVEQLNQRALPWIGSFHHFRETPDSSVLHDACDRAAEAGASTFKAAVFLASPNDLTRLAEFQLAEHPIPVATMGMGPLAPVSRLLCAQCGSVLNYGFLGKTPTAPGQWDAAFLKQAIHRLAPFPS